MHLRTPLSIPGPAVVSFFLPPAAAAAALSLLVALQGGNSNREEEDEVGDMENDEGWGGAGEEDQVEVGCWRAAAGARDRLLLARPGMAEGSPRRPPEIDEGRVSRPLPQAPGEEGKGTSAKESSTNLDSHSSSAASSLC